jgi:hypothetical protein
MNEEKFILNAARLDLSDENIARLKDISNKEIDWDLLSKKASFHGVTTFIYYSLKKHNLTHLLPADLFNKFKENHHLVGLRNLKFIKKIHELSNIIEEKIILLKGGYLIDNFYPDIGIRSMGDIDILVEKERAVHVWDLLESNGFSRNSPDRQKTTKSTVHNEFALSDHLDHLCSENCIIEVHWNLFGIPDLYSITKMGLEKAILIDCSDRLYRLSNEFFLIHLCSHFYTHTYSYNHIGNYLRMLCDINEFVLKRGHDIDWDEIEETCSDIELKNRILTTLTLAYYFLQTPVPANFIANNLISNNSISIDSLSHNKFIRAQNKKHILKRFFNRLGTLEKPVDKLIFIFKTFVPEREWIKAEYNANNFRELTISYFSYWSDLFSRYILNRDVKSRK